MMTYDELSNQRLVVVWPNYDFQQAHLVLFDMRGIIGSYEEVGI